MCTVCYYRIGLCVIRSCSTYDSIRLPSLFCVIIQEFHQLQLDQASISSLACVRVCVCVLIIFVAVQVKTLFPWWYYCNLISYSVQNAILNNAYYQTGSFTMTFAVELSSASSSLSFHGYLGILSLNLAWEAIQTTWEDAMTQLLYKNFMFLQCYIVAVAAFVEISCGLGN